MKTVKIETVIARVLRTTRKIEPDLQIALIEWIAEGLAQMYVPDTLLTKSAVLQVRGHIAQKPCGFYRTIAIEYGEGRERARLLLGTDITDFTRESFVRTSQPYYKEQLDTLHFSFESGEVTLDYYSLPVDERGYPLIPDVEECLNALFYYAIMNLCGAGFVHPTFNYEYCRQLYEGIYLPRAINTLRPFTAEKAQQLFNTTVRFILPQHAHYDFFKNLEQTQETITHVYQDKPRFD